MAFEELHEILFGLIQAGVTQVAAADFLAAAADLEEVAQVEAGRKSPILEAIEAAEKISSIEIRVHINQKLFDPNPLESAKKAFQSLGMFETRLRNGVLIYLNLRSKKIALYGDDGIHSRLETEWNSLISKFTQELHATHYENAVASIILDLGKRMAPFFPPTDSRNELPNEVSTSDFS